MSYVSNPAPPDTSPSRRRLIFPVVVLIVFGLLTAGPRIWNALGNDLDSEIPVMMFMPWFSAPLGLLLLVAWWFLFSGVPWMVRLGLPVVLIGAATPAAFFTIRKVEFTTNQIGMVPIIHFVWQPSAEAKLEEYLKKQPATDEDLPAIDATVGVEDFPSYRGLRRDGIVSHIKLETDWTKHLPKVLWRHPCAGGYSGIAVAGNIAVTIEQRDKNEVVVCYDRATGRQRWALPFDASYKDSMNMGDGPRSTPTIHDNLIYSVGASGDLVCVNTAGKKQWTVNLLEEAKAKNVQWGLTASPLIVDELVIAQAGSNPDSPADSSLLAFDRKTGAKRWAVGNRPAGYSSPQLVSLAKTPQILLFDDVGLVSYEPKTGRQLWAIDWKTEMSMNMMQPVVVGEDQVFISSERTNGCGLFRVSAPDNNAVNWRVEPVWKNKNLAARFANPVTDGKHLFGLQNLTGVLTCLNVKDGTVRWKGDRYGPGQLLLVDDLLLVVSERGEVSLLETDSSAANVLATFPLFDEKTWNTPALAGDQLFLRNQFEIACVRLPRR